ncbi:uncharacterized protein K02A2.6-like [Synchiropus splendidus]|uniref:uncharacterized protein K02A2.6-like n=1 Tax=Synchiropus splendidus TaxID=270530 RepID=UPI00237E2209|nr:uncharacterized protein K02A2.6-like [Synchiropus splendidus]
MEDELIRDQLIANVQLSAVKDKLLLEEELTLEKALAIACQVEAAVENASLLSSANTSLSASVQAVGATSSRFRGKRGVRPVKGPSRASVKHTNERQCYRCGSAKHLANDKSCPATKVKCNSCGKMGHFAKVCKSAVSEVREVVVPELAVLCVENVKQVAASKDKITSNIMFKTPEGNTTTLELIVDTGASVSILPETLYQQYLSQCPLTEPKVKLVTYAKQNLPVVGCLRVVVSLPCQTHRVNATFYIVKSGSPLLGLDLIKALKMSIIEGKVHHSKMKNAVVPSDMPQPTVNNVALEGLGCVKGFIHKVQVNKSVPPVRQKLRRLPLSVRNEVTEELKRLLHEGIIERVDASEWVSPLVVVRKRGGKIRLCVDLREPNKSVIMDCYPLPHMEDLFSELAGATHFSQIDLRSAYHQLPLHPESRSLTAFITHDGLFQFTRVPFGLASAPSAFQKMMQMILKDVTGVQNYLDDIIVYGHSRENHDCNLQNVLQRLKDAGLTINFDKSSLCQERIVFLGHVISKEGLCPSTDHYDMQYRPGDKNIIADCLSRVPLSSNGLDAEVDQESLLESLKRLSSSSGGYTTAMENSGYGIASELSGYSSSYYWVIALPTAQRKAHEDETQHPTACV